MASATATEITRRRQYREKLGKAEVVKSASQAHTPCLESAHPPPVHACPPILSLSPFAQSYSHGFGVPVTGQRSTIDGDMREAMHWTREEKKKHSAASQGNHAQNNCCVWRCRRPPMVRSGGLHAGPLALHCWLGVDCLPRLMMAHIIMPFPIAPEGSNIGP